MALREVAFDTETTGLNPITGDRVIEIACIEMLDRVSTGRKFDTLINPERDIPLEASKIHGRTNDDVKDSPIFADIADDFLSFIQDSPLVAHNAPFDFKFINHELSLIGYSELSNKMVDTLKIARDQRPRAQNSIDALCRHFGIDLSKREKHEALIDTQLLVSVYYRLLQKTESFDFSMGNKKNDIIVTRPLRSTGIFHAQPEEIQKHMQYIENKVKNSIWNS